MPGHVLPGGENFDDCEEINQGGAKPCEPLGFQGLHSSELLQWEWPVDYERAGLRGTVGDHSDRVGHGCGEAF